MDFEGEKGEGTPDEVLEEASARMKHRFGDPNDVANARATPKPIARMCRDAS